MYVSKGVVFDGAGGASRGRKLGRCILVQTSAALHSGLRSTSSSIVIRSATVVIRTGKVFASLNPDRLAFLCAVFDAFSTWVD